MLVSRAHGTPTMKLWSFDARRYMCVALDNIIFPKASFFARACKGNLEYAYVYPGEFGCTS